MKKILIAYPGLFLGGSTSSLLALLRQINLRQYDITLAIYDDGLPFQKYIPQGVNVVCVRKAGKNVIGLLKKICSAVLGGYFFRYLRSRSKDDGSQIYIPIVFQADCNSVCLKERFDLAIGFMEGWADEYVAKSVFADKKIAWIHTDISCLQYANNRLFLSMLSKMDTVVCVSESLRKLMCSMYPSISSRIRVFPNQISKEFLIERSLEVNSGDGDYVNFRSFNGIKILTVCRLDLQTKGLDRAVAAASALENKNANYIWYVLGDGADREEIERLIGASGVDKSRFKLCGLRENPAPFYSAADIFCLPSRYEGKPMAVTEAMSLGAVPVVTAYHSAHEQIKNGENGFIIKNDDDALADFLLSLYENSEKLNNIKDNLSKYITDCSWSINDLFR